MLAGWGFGGSGASAARGGAARQQPTPAGQARQAGRLPGRALLTGTTTTTTLVYCNEYDDDNTDF